MVRFLAILMAVLAAAPAVAADRMPSGALAECDRLAAHPYDPGRRAKGVPFDAIDAPSAVLSCAAAFSEQPGAVRYMYQYGRALLAAKRRNEAMIFIRAAADSGYAAAQQSLATLLYDDEAWSGDRITAIRLFHKAAAQGHPVAQLRVASFYLCGEGGPRDLAKAETFARMAAAQGLPAAQTALDMIVRAEHTPN